MDSFASSLVDATVVCMCLCNQAVMMSKQESGELKLSGKPVQIMQIMRVSSFARMYRPYGVSGSLSRLCTFYFQPIQAETIVEREYGQVWRSLACQYLSFLPENVLRKYQYAVYVRVGAERYNFIALGLYPRNRQTMSSGEGQLRGRARASWQPVGEILQCQLPASSRGQVARAARYRAERALDIIEWRQTGAGRLVCGAKFSQAINFYFEGSEQACYCFAITLACEGGRQVGR